jgi:uncharacterized protein involved in exopolysaccharide biosynthesis
MLGATFRFWWVIVVLSVAGGLLGLLFHRLNPPVYEAAGRFSASIDLVLTGPLTQLEEDIALNAVGDLITSRPVLDSVVEQAGAEGIRLTRAELRRMATVERRVNAWDLRIRHTDPLMAGQVANIWIEQGQAALLESSQHALQAASLSRYLRTLEDCLAVAAASEPSHALCSRQRFRDIQADLQQAGEALSIERKASGSLFYGLTIGPPEAAVTSEKPVRFGQNRLVLAGAVLGLLLGIGFVQSGLPARWRKSK